MRITDYYNYIATAAYILMGVAALYFYKRKKKNSKSPLSDRTSTIILVVIMAIATFLRLYRLGVVPLGLQQDEASIGYDAYTLANFGIDRNGYHFPIYPITWGCGGGSPLLIYLNVLSIKLFGTGIVKLRLIPAICGILTVLLFYLILKLIFSEKKYVNELSLLGAFFLAVCPWHVILSRWSLDSNIMPFNLMLSLYLFLLGAEKRSTLFYALSAASFSVCMYSYGAATIVIPVFLVLISAYALFEKVLEIKQLVISVLVFLLLFSPLLVFYAINYLSFPEIVTDYITFNKFTAARTGEAFISLNDGFLGKALNNLKAYALAMSVGGKFTIAHYLEGYGCLFEFTFPITAIGLVRSVRDLFSKKMRDAAPVMERVGNAAFIMLTISTLVLDIMILPDINRLVMAFIPFIYFFVRGAEIILECSGKLFLALAVILLLGGLLFTRDYFRNFNSWSISIYMPGYGDAIKRAYEIAKDDRPIASTYEGLSSPFMLALYYTEYDPYKFYTTVEYKDPDAEFRIAKSFGNFSFDLPEDTKKAAENGTVLVVASSEKGPFEGDERFVLEDFGGYFVVYRPLP